MRIIVERNDGNKSSMGINVSNTLDPRVVAKVTEFIIRELTYAKST